jgi:hypothetical protein
MDLQNLAVSLVQPGQDDDVVAGRQPVKPVRSERMYFKPDVGSAFRTLFRGFAPLF